MAFTESFFGPHNWQHFNFYKTAPGSVLSFITESINISAPWKLQELRLHFSTAMGSVKYLNIRVSSVGGSALNTILLSQDLNGVQDLYLHYSDPMLFFSDDQLVITTSVISVANWYGLQVIGWAVID